MKKVVVVLDIGKTNKKIVLYDSGMKLVKIFNKSFPSVSYEDLHVEQVREIEIWFLDTLAEIARTWDVSAISITTHGAALVCVGSDGYPAVPVIDYTQEVDESVHRRFFALVGDRDVMQEKTCTPELQPLINPAKLIFFTKERFPERFADVRTILFYPQYFAFRLTNTVHADFTYVGCHSYLWDYARRSWSDAAAKLGIANLLPAEAEYPGNIAGPITREVAEITGLSPETPVLVGVHDSNSSLVPYLLSGSGDFLLNSTGTWCVAMHPEKTAVLKKDDIGKTVFFNCSVKGTPVKTAIFLGGLELETWLTVFQKIHNRNDFPVFSPEIAEEVIREAEDFILPGVLPGTGQFPHADACLVSKGKKYPLPDIRSGIACPGILKNYEKSFTVLLVSLALHTRTAFMRLGLADGTPVYIEGKFRENAGYKAILASLFPANPVFTTGIDEATSFGAALLGWAAFEKKALETMAPFAQFEKIPVKALSLPGLEKYIDGFSKLTG